MMPDKCKLSKEVEGVAAQANFSLRPDVLKLIKQAYLAEHGKMAKKALGWIWDNARIAKERHLAVCQDSGLPVIFIGAGRDIKISSAVIKVIEDAVVRGYMKNYLRASMVDPLKRQELSYKGVITYVDFSSKIKGLNITVFPKGFGSENKSRLKMFNPLVGLEPIEDFIIESVQQAGPAGCPPFIVGVGIGGTSEQALLLAKKALLEKLDKSNPDKMLNNLEKRWLKKINALNIGPMGFGGRNTALAVKIKTAPTHIAGLPVGVNISCHALRSATLRIRLRKNEGS